MSTPNSDTGAVTGKITATDPEKQKLTYAVVGPAPAGLSFDTKTAAFTYTPTAAQRILAGLGTGPTTIGFTVAVSDGVNTTNAELNVPISTVSIADAGAFHIGGSGSGLVVSNTRAYVSNTGDNTITVIDTQHHTVIGSITLDSQAVGTALTPDGKKLYVATAELDAITVVNTATNAITSYIQTPDRYYDLITVSPDGKTLYALTDDETGATPVATVTKIATATDKVTGSVALPGATVVFDDNFDVTSFYSLVVTPDSKKVYVITDLAPAQEGDAAPSALFTFTGSAKTATLVTQGIYYVESAVSPDGKRLYVNDVDAGSVLVFNTATDNLLTSFSNSDGALGSITLNGDGSVLLAVNTDLNAVVVYETTSGAFTPISVVAAGVSTVGYYPAAALSPDGKELTYLADDGMLQVISVATGAPRAIPAPILGAPNPVTGAVTGTVTDATGKKLTYSLISGPTGGTLTFNKTTGTFTYTPTVAQRVLAGLDSTATTAGFTVTVSDGKTTVPVQVSIPIDPIHITGAGNIGTGSTPWGIAVTNTRAYVSNPAGSSIAVIDTIHGTTLASITVPAGVAGIAVTPDGKQLFAASYTDNKVLVIDTATGTISRTLTLAGKQPLSVAIGVDGKTAYVGSASVNADGSPALDKNGNPVGGTISKISTSSYKVTGTVTNVGVGPLTLTVAPDGKKIYVVSYGLNNQSTPAPNAVYVFASNAGKGTLISGVGEHATAITVSPDASKLYVAGSDSTVYVVETGKYRVVGSTDVGVTPNALTLTKDGSLLLVKSDDGHVSSFDAATFTQYSDFTADPNYQGSSPTFVLSPDGQQAYTLTSAGLQFISLTPPNLFPSLDAQTILTPTASGTVAGSLTVTDPDGDPLTYTATKPVNGTVTLNADGTFTYTPTAAARHAAAGSGATTDTFTISVDDGRRGILYRDITVDIVPTNADPTEKHTVGKPNSTTGVVTGAVTVTDQDKDTLTFTVSTAAKGNVTVTAKGGFTYTPTAAARHAAAALDATAADKADHFTITVSDNHGGVIDVPITVTISPRNSAPAGAKATILNTNNDTGVITGAIDATDSDADILAFTSTPPSKGTVNLYADGTFTYTPTDAARAAAITPTASAASKADTFTVTVSDGFGASTTTTVKVLLTPNHAPTLSTVKVGAPNRSSGVVTGTVIAGDTDRDTLTYSGTSVTGKGIVVVNAKGTFTFTPSAEARHAAAALGAPASDKSDSFTITASDGRGETITIPVTVTVGAKNAAPTNAKASNLSTNPVTGRVSGTITATDLDGDTVSLHAAPTTPKGTVVVNADNTFTYTPTAAAREAAGAAKATTAAKTDSFSVTVVDAYGGQTVTTVKVGIVPAATGNRVPVADGSPYDITVDNTTGTVSGHVHVTDTDGSALTYSLDAGMDPAVGTVTLNAGTGAFTFTPTTRTRLHAWSTPGADTVGFTINASDGQDGAPVDIAAPVLALAPAAGGTLQAAELKDLIASGDVDVSENYDGTVRTIYGAFTGTVVHSSADAAAALNQVAKLLGAPPGFATAVNITSQTISATGEAAQTYYRLTQTVNGVPVLGNQITLSTDADGHVTGVFSTFDSAVSTTNTTPAAGINVATQANDVVKAAILSGLGNQLDAATTAALAASLTYHTGLVIYAVDASLPPTLAWQVAVTNAQAFAEDGPDLPYVDQTYYIAASGAHASTILTVEDPFDGADVAASMYANDELGKRRILKVVHDASLPAGTLSYRLIDTSRNITTYGSHTYDALQKADAKGTLDLDIVRGAPGNWISSTISAHANIETIYDYYKYALGFNGFDNMPIRVAVVDRLDILAWSAVLQDKQNKLYVQLVFSDGSEAALDIAAHEYTHAVVRSIVGAGAGLGPSFESKALSEAYADILGSLIEGKTGADRYIIGEDISGCSYRSSSFGCGIRYTADPSLAFNPHTGVVDGVTHHQIYGENHENYSEFHTSDNYYDDSTIFSFAAEKMMTDAGTTGVTRDKWATLFYKSLYNLSPGATFVDARFAVLATAKSMGFTTKQMTAMQQAFTSVGIVAGSSYHYGSTSSVGLGSTPGNLAVSGNANYAYVIANGQLKIIDTRSAPTPTITTVSVGSNPTGVAVSSDGGTAYVTNSSSGTVSLIFNTAIAPIVTTIAVGGNPTGVGTSADGRTAYVANTSSGTVSIIDNSGKTPVVKTVVVGGNPGAVAVSSTGSRAFITNSSANTVSIVDKSGGIQTVAVAGGPKAIKVSADGSTAVVYSGNGTVSIIKTTGSSPTVVQVPGYFDSYDNVGFMALSQNGSRAFVTQHDNVNTLAMIDTTTATPTVTYFSLGDLAHSVATTADGTRAFVVTHGALYVIDTRVAHPTPVATNITINNSGSDYQQVAVSADGKFVIATDISGNFTVLNGSAF
ncbi:Ig-like domain-containing protein [Mycobacterium sp. BMJ-28]